jgi:hypothetical protein
MNWELPSSIGGFDLPNKAEGEAAEQLAREIPVDPLSRSVLVVTGDERPARRMLKALALARPGVGRNVVAVTGDTISVNTVYRDGGLKWNISEVPIPVVFFAHQNPVAWRELGPDDGRAGDGVPTPPNATDNYLINVALAGRLLAAVLPSLGGGEPANSADVATKRMFQCDPPFFKPNGDRHDGGGEHVVCLLPRTGDDGTIVRPEAVMTVFRRIDPKRWEKVDCRRIDYRAR